VVGYSSNSSGSVTFTVNAFTMLAGSVQVAYNALSATVGGGSAGSTVTYFLFLDDPHLHGGSQPLGVTLNGNDVYTTDSRVYIGPVSVVFPAAGGGSGSGGGGGGGGGACVCSHMLVYGDRTSGESKPGDLFDCLDIPTKGFTKFKRRLIAAEYAQVECVRITTAKGAILECSTTTPFDLIDGGMTYAPLMLNEMVVTDLGIEKVIEVVSIGTQWVSHNHFGGISYAAGADPEHRIYSHNVYAKP
jgi:hypothetical protein